MSCICHLSRMLHERSPGRWRKRKGFATVRLPDGRLLRAEIHWYEAGGLGKQEFKIKRIVE